MAGTFIYYRVYHDRLLHSMGYEIQEDFDARMDYYEDSVRDGAGVDGCSGVEFTRVSGVGEAVTREAPSSSSSAASSFVLEAELDDGTMSALRI